MVRRGSFVFALLACMSCTTASLSERPGCPEEVTAEWQIPAGWYVRVLTPEKAHQQVLVGNLGIEAIRERWQALHDQWREAISTGATDDPKNAGSTRSAGRKAWCSIVAACSSGL
jgi:hypothetical protein